MSQQGVLRPGHAGIRVLDMEAAIKHYVDHIGLIEVDRDDEGRVYLKAWDEHDKFSVVLREADHSGIDFFGFKVRRKEDLDELETKLNAYGCDTRRVAAGELRGCGERLIFMSPSGHTFELYAEKDPTDHPNGTQDPTPWPDGLKGMAPLQFDHGLLYGPNIDETAAIFTEVLDFQIAEEIHDAEGNNVALFLSVSNKAHDIAFVKFPEPGKLHHVSFLMRSFEDVLRAGDIMGRNDITVEMGPTRHGATRGQTIYFFDPSGNRNEVFTSGSSYHWYPDKPKLVWTAESEFKAVDFIGQRHVESFWNVCT